MSGTKKVLLHVNQGHADAPNVALLGSLNDKGVPKSGAVEVVLPRPSIRIPNEDSIWAKQSEKEAKDGIFTPCSKFERDAVRLKIRYLSNCKSLDFAYQIKNKYEPNPNKEEDFIGKEYEAAVHYEEAIETDLWLKFLMVCNYNLGNTFRDSEVYGLFSLEDETSFAERKEMGRNKRKQKVELQNRIMNDDNFALAQAFICRIDVDSMPNYEEILLEMFDKDFDAYIQGRETYIKIVEQDLKSFIIDNNLISTVNDDGIFTIVENSDAPEFVLEGLAEKDANKNVKEIAVKIADDNTVMNMFEKLKLKYKK